MDRPITNEISGGLAGRVLIAMPQLRAGAFARSVVLMARHDRHQAFGLIINRPIQGVRARDVLDVIGLDPSVTAGPLPVFVGGPVESERGFILHSSDFQDPQTQPIPGGLALSGHRRALERIVGETVRPHRSRLFLGYAGWSPGQLESELRRQAWLDVDVDADFVFNTPPEVMWRDALTRLGLDEAQLWSMASERQGTPVRAPTRLN